MTALALRNLKDVDSDEFWRIANRLITASSVCGASDSYTEMGEQRTVSQKSNWHEHDISHEHLIGGNDNGGHSAKRMRPPVGKTVLLPRMSDAGQDQGHYCGVGVDSMGLPIPLPDHSVAPSRWRPGKGKYG